MRMKKEQNQVTKATKAPTPGPDSVKTAENPEDPISTTPIGTPIGSVGSNDRSTPRQMSEPGSASAEPENANTAVVKEEGLVNGGGATAGDESCDNANNGTNQTPLSSASGGDGTTPGPVDGAGGASNSSDSNHINANPASNGPSGDAGGPASVPGSVGDASQEDVKPPVTSLANTNTNTSNCSTPQTQSQVLNNLNADSDGFLTEFKEEPGKPCFYKHIFIRGLIREPSTSYS